MPTDVRACQDGQSLQVVLRNQYLLFRGQTVGERAVTLALLRRLKAQSQRDPAMARWTQQGRWN